MTRLFSTSTALLALFAAVVSAAPSNTCTKIQKQTDYDGAEIKSYEGKTSADCCKLCWENTDCKVYTFSTAYMGRNGVVTTCSLKSELGRKLDLTIVADLNIEASIVRGAGGASARNSTSGAKVFKSLPKNPDASMEEDVDSAAGSAASDAEDKDSASSKANAVKGDASMDTDEMKGSMSDTDDMDDSSFASGFGKKLEVEISGSTEKDGNKFTNTRSGAAFSHQSSNNVMIQAVVLGASLFLSSIL